MTVKGGTTPACAACKYQRRRCVPTCPLAPFFPSNQPKTFQNVHRLFGVSNVTKTINSLQTKDQKEDAMKSIIFEADMRERYPVYGCSMIICQLRFQLQCALEELRCIYPQLASCRENMNKHVDQSTSVQPEPNTYSNGADSMQVFHHNQSTESMVAKNFMNESNSFHGESSLDNMSKPWLRLDHFDGESSLDNMSKPLVGEYFDGISNSNNLVALQAQMDSFSIQGRETLNDDIFSDRVIPTRSLIFE